MTDLSTVVPDSLVSGSMVSSRLHPYPGAFFFSLPFFFKDPDVSFPARMEGCVWRRGIWVPGSVPSEPSCLLRGSGQPVEPSTTSTQDGQVTSDCPVPSRPPHPALATGKTGVGGAAHTAAMGSQGAKVALEFQDLAGSPHVQQRAHCAQKFVYRLALPSPPSRHSTGSFFSLLSQFLTLT